VLENTFMDRPRPLSGGRHSHGLPEVNIGWENTFMDRPRPPSSERHSHGSPKETLRERHSHASPVANLGRETQS
jgi:hypothetical protein